MSSPNESFNEPLNEQITEQSDERLNQQSFASLEKKRKTDLPEIREFDGYDWFFTKTYRRNLPHWELPGSTYFITSRVSESNFRPFVNSDLARALISVFYRDHETKYLLYAYVVMPDHFHIILKPLEGNHLADIMQNIKGFSAYTINKLLNRKGKFWQKENFDHLIRDGIGLRDKWDYIRENPVKAKLVENGEDYPFSSFYVPK